VNPAEYRENHCALRWPLLLQGFGVPALTVAGCAALAATGHLGTAGLLVLGMLAGPWCLVGAMLVARVWPTGIRADASGIRIGACQRAERLGSRGRWPPDPPPRVANQRYAVFECPAREVRKLTVVTSRAELAGLYQQARRYRRRWGGTVYPLGWIPAPFMRAGLLIEVDPGYMPAQRFRPTYSGHGLQISGQMSATWLVPTRDPQALRSALAQLPLPPVQEHIGSAPINFESDRGEEAMDDYLFPPGRPSYVRTVGLAAAKVTAFAVTTLFLGALVIRSITSPGSLSAIVADWVFSGSLWLAATTWLFRPWWRRRREAREEQRPRHARDPSGWDAW
jgi:hypothetical protein